ncbi:hypothetical protein Q7P37_009721 [Cladosporium fusiforme]
MTDPLSVVAGVAGIIVPALHCARLLANDIQNIADAPGVVMALGSDLSALDGNLETIRSINDDEWALLGPAVASNTTTAVASCNKACESFRGDLQRWTKRSRDGKLSWRDRTNLGFFKERQIRAMSEQLQSCKGAFTNVVATATFSIQNTRMSKELWGKFSAQEATTNANAAFVDSQIAVVERSLAALNTDEEAHSQMAEDVDDEEIGGAEMQLREEVVALRSSQNLLSELSRLVKREEVEKLTSKGSDHSTTISFGDNNRGLQTGINHGAVNWTSGK